MEFPKDLCFNVEGTCVLVWNLPMSWCKSYLCLGVEVACVPVCLGVEVTCVSVWKPKLEESLELKTSPDLKSAAILNPWPCNFGSL